MNRCAIYLGGLSQKSTEFADLLDVDDEGKWSKKILWGLTFEHLRYKVSFAKLGKTEEVNSFLIYKMGVRK